jgi:hypothetical protein
MFEQCNLEADLLEEKEETGLERPCYSDEVT